MRSRFINDDYPHYDQGQHASHETNTRGNFICKRLGAACNFIVPDESMLEVVQWIVENTPFDRLYYYRDDKPVHISIGPENSKDIAIKKTTSNERLYPVMCEPEQLLKSDIKETVGYFKDFFNLDTGDNTNLIKKLQFYITKLYLKEKRALKL